MKREKKLNKVSKYKKKAEWWELRISNGVIMEEFTMWDEECSTLALCRAADNIFNFRLSYCHVRNVHNI